MDEAENLRRLFAGITNRAKFARLHNLNATMINQHLTGERPISLKYAVVYANALNLKLKDISERLANEVKMASSLAVNDPYSPLQAENANGINLPLLNVKASMGHGEEFKNDDLVIDVLRVTKSWVDKTFTNISSISNLSFIHAIGDSMHPTFNDGDILLVDSGVNNAMSDNIYVLEAHGRLFIKRVRRRLDGSYEISSDNPAVKTVDILNGETEVSIKGRVVWVWNGRKI